MGVEPRISGPFGRGGEGAGGHGFYSVLRYLQGHAVFAGQVQHETGIAVPGSFASGYQVVKAGYLWSVLRSAQGVGGNVGQQVGPSGRADLVVYYGKCVSFLAQAQHGLGEVAATCGIHPTGAKGQVLAAGFSDGGFAFRLGLAVNVQWIGGIGFHPGGAAAAIEYVVGGIVHQPGVEALGFKS